ncbi:PREDICTED: HIRA-interacting protein 3 isoform X2 [Thamnophis sirtalis]|uniref:HIRA-interacting protein 3 isoform X2 n=1 Tax=Thamnophis sirtalis TaxID=35019 RepID=A0A6I9Y2N4_9SAUR|nr:PREDICTED: HIRA-interacting protein 3 isoform X2 [Thamnophis sirtalis]
MAGADGQLQQQKMRDFVSRLFQGSPDLSILTHAIIRKKYLDDVGLENLSKQEKEQLKQLVEEELVQIKVDQPPSNVELRTEAQHSFKSGDHKRPLHISHSLEDEIKNEQKQKKQKIEKKLVSSDEKDSGIDSKKRPCYKSQKRRSMISDSSDQGNSGAGNNCDESESDEETTKSKRKPSLQEARRERGPGTIRGSQKRGVSESEETTTDTGQSDLEDEVKGQRKAIKRNSLKQRDFKKKVDKESKANDPKGKAKIRTMSKQREERSLSEGETDLSEVEEISEKKREWSESEEKKPLSTNKAQQRMGPGTQKGSKENKSEDDSGSGSDKKCNLQKKMADSQCRRKSRVIEDSGSSSENSASQSPMKKEGAKRARGERGSPQTGNHSKPKRQPKERGVQKKLPREDLHMKKPEEVKKMTQKVQESTSEESESESGECKSMGAEENLLQIPTSSEDKTNQGQPREEALISSPSESESDGDPRRALEKESKHDSESDSSQGEEKLRKRGLQGERNRGQPKKAALSSPSESESEKSEDGDPRRTLEKESKHDSESDSSQGEETLKKRGAQKTQRKSISKEISVLGSEDSGSELKGKKKIQSQQQRTTKKLQRRSATKEKQGEESSQEKDSSSEEDEPTTSRQQHLGKDKKHRSGKKEEHPSIQRLKRYIRECGVHRNYKKLLAGCHSRKAQIEVLKEELESLGIKGTPSLARCKALKQKREEVAKLASLDVNNIIATEGRPKRRNVWSLYNEPQELPSSPEEPAVRRRATDWSHLRGVISSDGESG